MSKHFDTIYLEEEKLFSQIKSYYESQNILKELIQKNIQKTIELYLINDEWLDNWKQNSFYNEIKMNLDLNNENNWKQIIQKNKSKENVSTSLNIEINGNMSSNFHLVTKECFENFIKNSYENNTNIIKLTFESYNKKIIAKFFNTIIVLYIYKNNFNLVLFILDEQNNNNLFDFNFIKQSNMNEYLKQIGIDDNTEKKVISLSKDGFSYNIEFINKSFKTIKEKENKCKNLLAYLLNFDFNFDLLLKQIMFNKTNNYIMYLINEDSIIQILNYLNTLYNNQQQSVEENKNEMEKKIFENESNNNELELINQNQKIFNYLKDNKSGNIYKLYTNYKLLNQEIWHNIKTLFKWNIEIQIYIYFLNNNFFIIQYDEKSFEIVEISNNIIHHILLFYIHNNYNTNELINEILNLGFNGYLQKYNINLLISEQSSQDIIDYSNNNQNVGIIININNAKNNSEDFNILKYDELGQDKLNLGLNINNEQKNIMNNNSNNTQKSDNISNNMNSKQNEINNQNSDIDEVNQITKIMIKNSLKKRDFKKFNIPNLFNNNINNDLKDKESFNNNNINNNNLMNLINNNISNNFNNENKIENNNNNNNFNNNLINNNMNNIINIPKHNNYINPNIESNINNLNNKINNMNISDGINKNLNKNENIVQNANINNNNDINMNNFNNINMNINNNMVNMNINKNNNQNYNDMNISNMNNCNINNNSINNDNNKSSNNTINNFNITNNNNINNNINFKNNNFNNNNNINNNMNFNNNNFNNMKNINYNGINNINMMNSNMNYNNINNNMNNLKNNNMNNINNNINNINNNMNNINNNMNNIKNNNINNINTNMYNNNMNNNMNNINSNNINFMNNNNVNNINNSNMNNIINNDNNMKNINNFNNNNNMNFMNFNNMNNNNNNSNNNNLMNMNNINNFNNTNLANNNYQFNNQINNMNNQINMSQNNFIPNFNMNYNNNINMWPNQNMINIEPIKSVIQCLGDCKLLTNYFLNPSKYNEYISFIDNFPITSKYAIIIKKAMQNSNNFNKLSIELKNLIEKKYKITLSSPKDILKYIIESIHEENKTPIENNNFNQMFLGTREQIYNYFLKYKFIPENTTIISNNFFGVKETIKECTNCKSLKYEYELFKLIEFQIEEIYKYNMISKANKILLQNKRMNKFNNDIMFNKGEKKININDLFYYYVYCQKEKKDSFFCNKCNFQNIITKYNYKFTILPNYLCITLNRDSNINIKVEIEENIELPFLMKIKKYELIGIISYNQQNNDYFSMSRNRLDNQWYMYKGDNISPFNIINVYNYGLPYILFYQVKI